MLPILSNLLGCFGMPPSTRRYEQQRHRMAERYAQYHNIAESEVFKRFLELGQSAMPDNKAEAKKQRSEYRKLKRSGVVKTFYRLEKKYKTVFEETDRWTPAFTDEFRGDRLNNTRWNTQPFWSLKMPMAGYVQNTEYHHTDPANVVVKDNMLQIITQPVAQKGVAWDKQFGFVPQQFNYSSGLVNTMDKFALRYGKIEVKLRIPVIKNIYHALWLTTGETAPAISIFNYCNHRFETGIYQNTGDNKYSRRMRFNAGRFYIMEIEWDEHYITWRLNGKELAKKANTVNVPLHVHIASGIVGKVPAQKLPCRFDIGWIRAYNKTS